MNQAFTKRAKNVKPLVIWGLNRIYDVAFIVFIGLGFLSALGLLFYAFYNMVKAFQL